MLNLQLHKWQGKSDLHDALIALWCHKCEKTPRRGNTLYLEGELGLALRLSPHNEGENQTNHQDNAEDGQRPGRPSSLDSNNTEDAHQNTCGGEESKTVKRGHRRMFCVCNQENLCVCVCVSHQVHWCRCWRQTRTEGTALCLKGSAGSWWWGDPPAAVTCRCSPRCKIHPFHFHPGCWPSRRPRWGLQAGTFRQQHTPDLENSPLLLALWRPWQMFN